MKVIFHITDQGSMASKACHMQEGGQNEDLRGISCERFDRTGNG